MIQDFSLIFLGINSADNGRIMSKKISMILFSFIGLKQGDCCLCKVVS